MAKEMEFTPKQWVLVRDNKEEKWTLAQFSHYDDAADYSPYFLVGGNCFQLCIPYERNEHLLGTTDDYVEPFEPKDGDFVYVKSRIGCPNNEYVLIHNYTDSDGRIYTHTEKCLAGELFGTMDDLFLYDEFLMWKQDIQTIRHATEEEKNQLLSKLHEIGKDWDAEKKEIVDYEWHPREGEGYWYVNDECDVVFDGWSNDDVDRARYENGNCFRTEEETDVMADKIKKVLKGE